MHLQHADLAYTSIRPHFAAVAAYLQNRQYLSLFKVQGIKAFKEGLKRVIPPRGPAVPAWNLNIVLTRPMGPHFEPLLNCPLQFLSCKVGFLILTTSLRHAGELQALTLEKPFFQLHKDRVVLRTNPTFLPNVVSAFHISQAVQLPVFFLQHDSVAERALQTLDVKRALLCYIDRTKDFHNTTVCCF